jgi:ABC-type sulfate transport system substrate-binding protein
MKFSLLSLILAVSALAAPSEILNVSNDVTREFYPDQIYQGR